MSNELTTKGGNGHNQLAAAPVAQPAASVPNAVQSVMDGLRQAITGMNADDVSVELSANQEGNRSSARFSIRAYRRGQKVMDNSRDDEDGLDRE